MEVLDIDSLTLVGIIPKTPGVHGVALAPEVGRGFVSNGQASTVTIFDLKTLKPIADVPTASGLGQWADDRKTATADELGAGPIPTRGQSEDVARGAGVSSRARFRLREARSGAI